jgi:hypothetical protein
MVEPLLVLVELMEDIYLVVLVVAEVLVEVADITEEAEGEGGDMVVEVDHLM